MDIRDLIAEPLIPATPVDFSVSEVVVRLARPDERVKWDEVVPVGWTARGVG